MRTVFAILFTIVLVFQVTVMAAENDPQPNGSSSEPNNEKCNTDIVSFVDKAKGLNEKLTEIKISEGFDAACAFSTAVKEANELFYNTIYDCCAIPREVTMNITNEILDDLHSKNSLWDISKLIQPLIACLADRDGPANALLKTAATSFVDFLIEIDNYLIPIGGGFAIDTSPTFNQSHQVDMPIIVKCISPDCKEREKMQQGRC